MSDDAEPLPSRIPHTGPHFPNETFEQIAGSRIVQLNHGSMGQMTVTLADGRVGAYSQSTDPQRPGWLLHR